MANQFNRIKTCLLMLLVARFTLTNGIQVYENNENDLTTATTKLVAVLPTVGSTESSQVNVTIEPETSPNNTDTIVPNENVNSTGPVQYPTTSTTSTPRTEKILKTYKNSDRDQQHKGTTNVDQKKFVPSQQISIVGTIEDPKEAKRENFMPTNAYYKPESYEPYYNNVGQTSQVSPATHQSYQHWKLPTDKSIKNYHSLQYEEQPKPSWQQAPSSNELGKWYWMPNLKETDKHITTEKPAPPSYNDGWKWVFEGVKPKIMPSSITAEPNTFDPFKTYHFHHESHPYSFDSATPSGSPVETPFSYSDNGKPPTVEPIFTTAEVPSSAAPSDSEWAQYWLKEHEKDKGNKSKEMDTEKKRKSVSPWKKIVHVLTAAIPIGLLISALTPNVVYVDPNSTSFK